MMKIYEDETKFWQYNSPPRVPTLLSWQYSTEYFSESLCRCSFHRVSSCSWLYLLMASPWQIIWSGHIRIVPILWVARQSMRLSMTWFIVNDFLVSRRWHRLPDANGYTSIDLRIFSVIIIFDNVEALLNKTGRSQIITPAMPEGQKQHKKWAR